MTIYTVHLPRDATTPGSAEGLDRAVLVKDGFQWLALVLPIPWLLYKRAWRVLLAYVVMLVVVVVGGRFAGLSELVVAVVELLLTLFLALHAGNVASAALRRRGFPTVGVVSAHSEEEAERRFFTRWLTNVSAPGRPADQPPRGAGPSFEQPQAVLGLFPHGGSLR
jgi:hypothetical protein